MRHPAKQLKAIVAMCASSFPDVTNALSGLGVSVMMLQHVILRAALHNNVRLTRATLS
jgi:hypothetical protein